MSRIEDGSAVEAGLDLVAELVSLSELDRLGGFWASARIHRRAADRLASDAAEITRLRAENAGMREALDGIANKLSALRMQAEKDGGGRDGRLGAFLSNDIAYLIRIAALSKASQAEGGEK